MPTITYTPDTSFFGEDSFQYRVTNDDATYSIATVTVTVANGTFEVLDDALTLTVGVPFSHQLFLNDELVGLSATYGVVGSLPEGMTLDSNGLVSGTLLTESSGSVGVTVVLANSSAAGSTLTWTARAADGAVDAWLSPLYDPPVVDTDADRIVQALDGVSSWSADFSLTATDLKTLGDTQDPLDV